MNRSRLDELTRAIASGHTRRRLLAGMLASLPMAHLTQAASSAQFFCRQIGRSCTKNGDCCPSMVCAKQRCACPRGYRLCDGVCRDLSSDPNHCGACGFECDDPRMDCISGVCLLIGTPAEVAADEDGGPSFDGDVEVPGAPPPVAGS